MKEYELYLLRTNRRDRLIRRRGTYASAEHAHADFEAKGYIVISVEEL